MFFIIIDHLNKSKLSKYPGILTLKTVSPCQNLARPRTLLIAHRVGQRSHESFYPGSAFKQKSIKPYKNLIIYEVFKFL